MKEYKGWELIKGIEDGSIKEGDKFTFINSNNIKREIECDGKSMIYADKIATRCFSLANGYTFIKVQKPLTFFEAIAKADEGKKVTNDYLLSIDSDYEGHYSKIGNELRFFSSSNSNEGEVISIIKNEITSNWYIYEE